MSHRNIAITFAVLFGIFLVIDAIRGDWLFVALNAVFILSTIPSITKKVTDED